jgi:hypothetical protein
MHKNIIAEDRMGNSFCDFVSAVIIIMEVMRLSMPVMHIRPTSMIAGEPGSPPVCSIPKTINMLVTNEKRIPVSKDEIG